MNRASDPIFSRIAKRYDRINRILSLGRERAWRRRGVDMLSAGSVLDLGCGTGDTDFVGRQVVGLDPVVEMLSLSPVEQRVAAVGEAIPLASNSMDGVFSAFVFRNLQSVPQTLDEVERVLKPGRTAVVVDLGRPGNPILRWLHRAGTAVVLPLVGLLFAGAPREYWYLHRSLDSLPQPEELFSTGALTVEAIWRSGLFGFVYGVRLRKAERALSVDPEAA